MIRAWRLETVGLSIWNAFSRDRPIPWAPVSRIAASRPGPASRTAARPPEGVDAGRDTSGGAGAGGAGLGAGGGASFFGGGFSGLGGAGAGRAAARGGAKGAGAGAFFSGAGEGEATGGAGGSAFFVKSGAPVRVIVSGGGEGSGAG